MVPTIDFNNIDPQVLGKAFEEHGFVAVKNTNIKIDTLQKGYKVTQEFFSQSQEKKMEIRNPKNSGERGYVINETPRLQPKEVTDFKEILHIGREEPNYPKNIWPENLPMKDNVMPLFDAFEKMLTPIAEAASIYLGESKNKLPEMMEKGDHLLRFLHYLRTVEKTKNWAAAHTDMNFLTLIPEGIAEGLQVQLKSGKWIDAPENVAIINVGDTLEHITNGFFRSGVHRVISKEGGIVERYSVVFHGHIRHDLDMKPLEKAIEKTGGKQQFPDGPGQYFLYHQIAAVGRASDKMLDELENSGAMEKLRKYGKASPKVELILKERKYV